jgi:hypothetical protein
MIFKLRKDTTLMKYKELGYLRVKFNEHLVCAPEILSGDFYTFLRINNHIYYLHINSIEASCIYTGKNKYNNKYIQCAQPFNKLKNGWTEIIHTKFPMKLDQEGLLEIVSIDYYKNFKNKNVKVVKNNKNIFVAVVYEILYENHIPTVGKIYKENKNLEELLKGIDKELKD